MNILCILARQMAIQIQISKLPVYVIWSFFNCLYFLNNGQMVKANCTLKVEVPLDQLQDYTFFGNSISEVKTQKRCY
jgi:hypothetical protein